MIHNAPKQNIFLATFVTILCIGSSNAQEPNSPKMRIVTEKLLAQKKMLKSVQFAVKESRVIPAITEDPNLSTYLWSFDGQKVLKKRKTDTQFMVTFFDGKQEQDRSYLGNDDKTGRLSQVTYATRGFVSVSAPNPLTGNYRVQDKWLYDVVSGGVFTVNLGTPDPVFGETYVVSGVGADKGQYRFVLAPKYGWVCIRSFQNYRSTRGNKEVVTQTLSKVTSLQKNKGVWLPKYLETHKLYNNEYTKKMTPFEDATLEISVRGLNDLPKNHFVLPIISEGTTIVDRDTMMRYKLKNGKRVPEAGPVTSRDNFWRWGFVGSVATGVFGATIFGVNKRRNTT